MVRRQLILSGVLLLLVGAVVLVHDRAYRRHSPAAELEDQLHRDIHTGMTRAEIEAYLNRVGIAHTYVEKFDKGKSLERTVVALIPDRSTGLEIVRTDVQIRFTLDEAGRLTNYDVKELLTGP
ncbi:MAG TPA: hypothetical protein VEG64_15370 [Candidatus Sulfotelmatobacter sp.]|nr:hypothetical protein [Candidatus Sulfotelmatobacter sp.]